MKYRKWGAVGAAVVLGVGWGLLAGGAAVAVGAPGSSADNPIVLSGPGDAPAGAVTSGPVTDPVTGQTSQTWTVTTPGAGAVTHEEYQYSTVVDVAAVTEDQTVHHDAVTHVVHHDAVTHDEQQVAPNGYAYCQQSTGKTKYLSDPAWNGQDTTGGDKGWNRCAGSDQYVTVQVVDQAAWDETVTDADGWDETVIDHAAWDETVTDSAGWDEIVTTVVTPASQEVRYYDGSSTGSLAAGDAVWTPDQPAGWDQLAARTVTDAAATPDTVTYYVWRSSAAGGPAGPGTVVVADPIDPGTAPDPATPPAPAAPVVAPISSQGGPHASGVGGPEVAPAASHGVVAPAALVTPAAVLPQTGAPAYLRPLGAASIVLVLLGGLLMVVSTGRWARWRA